MSKILITGATGLIGQHLVHKLAPHHTIYALTRHHQPPQTSEVEWIKCDLAHPIKMKKIPEYIDTIIHLAQSPYYRDFPNQALDIFNVGVQSTLHLLDYTAHKKHANFILASSGGTYGYSSTPVAVTEEQAVAPLNTPLSFYLTTKYLSELIAHNYMNLFPIVIMRFFFVYGPGQRQTMLIPSLLARIRQQQPITIDGNPGMVINPIFVGDAVRVFEPAMSLGTSLTVNVAGDEHLSITDIVHYLEDATHQKGNLQHNHTPEPKYLIGDNSKMKRILKVSPEVSFAEGIQTLL